MNKKLQIFTIAVLFIFIYLFYHKDGYAVTIGVTGEAPETIKVIQACLNRGGTIQECAKEGEVYQDTECGFACGAGGTLDPNCNNDSCILTCDNGAIIVITNDPTATTAPPLAPTATVAPSRAPTATTAPPAAPTATTAPSRAPTATVAPSRAPTATVAPSRAPTATTVPSRAPTATVAPSPTTDPFNTSMCKCDGLSYTPIAIGSSTKITAYGKVDDINKNYAKIPSFTFTFFQSSSNSNQATIIKKSDVNTTEIVRSLRYQADWNLDIPSNIDSSKTYRIQAKPNCVKKAAFLNRTMDVAGVETVKQKSIWETFIDFFSNLFNTNDAALNSVEVSENVTPTPSKKNSLQLQTFRPVSVSTGTDVNNCTFIKFSF